MGTEETATVTLRPSAPGDVDALFRIWHTAVRKTHHFLGEDDIAHYARLVREEYLPGTPFMVALDADGRVAGFLGMNGDKIDALFVDPDRHGQGIGRALVAHARRGRAVLHVDVNEANGGAREFYRRLGFREVGRSPLDGSGRPFPLIHMTLDAV